MAWAPILTIRCGRPDSLCFMFSMSELEAPFFPREKLIEKQKYFQSIHKHTYLKGRYDKITSVAIPLALAISSSYLIVSIRFLLVCPSLSPKKLDCYAWCPTNFGWLLQRWFCYLSRVRVYITCPMELGRKNEKQEDLHTNSQGC